MTLDLEAIKARAEAASLGPWHAKAYRVHGALGIIAACWRPWGPVTGDGSIEADDEFIAHARTDVPALVAEVERLRVLVRSQMVNAGPYMLTQWTDDIQHVGPCDCDLDEETAGDRCMANSKWTYAVVVDGGAFAPRLIVKLPRRSPEQRDDDLDPLVAVEPERLS